MTHLTEREFTDRVEAWFVETGGVRTIERNRYQPGPYWFVDLYVDMPPVDLYIEVENDAESVRDGIGQALGYAADHANGIPMLVVPPDHVHRPDVQRLRDSQAVLIRAFDPETDGWV